MNLLKYLDTRLGEASTWATVAAVLTLAHVTVDPGVLHALTIWGAGASAILGVLLKDSGKPPMQVAEDVGAALVAMTDGKSTSPTTTTGSTQP